MTLAVALDSRRPSPRRKTRCGMPLPAHRPATRRIGRPTHSPTPHTGSADIAASPTNASPGRPARRVVFGMSSLPRIFEIRSPVARSGAVRQSAEIRLEVRLEISLEPGLPVLGLERPHERDPVFLRKRVGDVGIEQPQHDRVACRQRQVAVVGEVAEATVPHHASLRRPTTSAICESRPSAATTIRAAISRSRRSRSTTRTPVGPSVRAEQGRSPSPRAVTSTPGTSAASSRTIGSSFSRRMSYP